jgi:ubiquinone/menaquinone biosynthesis C-methylase UbiE
MMARIAVRILLFYSMATLSILEGITGFALYSWESKTRTVLLGLSKSGWADAHFIVALSLTIVLILHLFENRLILPLYIGTVLGVRLGDMNKVGMHESRAVTFNRRASYPKNRPDQLDTSEEHATVSKYDRMHFATIRVVHETLYGLFTNPYRKLIQTGVKRGQQVLDVGCGPGFFTIPAAKIVGETGHVYALDINPAAVQYVRRKTKREGLTNVEVRLADASQTSLPKESIDLAFLFAVIHSFQDVNKVLTEMHRLLKTSGILSVQSRWPKKKLLETVTASGLFHLREETHGVFAFEKARN